MTDKELRANIHKFTDLYFEGTFESINQSEVLRQEVEKEILKK